jgi:hypothetical protein
MDFSSWKNSLKYERLHGEHTKDSCMSGMVLWASSGLSLRGEWRSAHGTKPKFSHALRQSCFRGKTGVAAPVPVDHRRASEAPLMPSVCPDSPHQSPGRPGLEPGPLLWWGHGGPGTRPGKCGNGFRPMRPGIRTPPGQRSLGPDQPADVSWTMIDRRAGSGQALGSRVNGAGAVDEH